MKIYLAHTQTNGGHIDEIAAAFYSFKDANCFLNGWMKGKGYLPQFGQITEVELEEELNEKSKE